MTRLTFYVHEQDGDPELWVCRLLDKIARSGQHCFVMGADEAALDALDRRLWTFSQGSASSATKSTRCCSAKDRS